MKYSEKNLLTYLLSCYVLVAFKLLCLTSKALTIKSAYFFKILGVVEFNSSINIKHSWLNIEVFFEYKLLSGHTISWTYKGKMIFVF